MGMDLESPAFEPKNQAGAWGRKSGRLVGLAHGLWEFAEGTFFFGAAVAETLLFPPTDGASAFATPITAAEAAQCIEADCFLAKNLKQKIYNRQLVKIQISAILQSHLSGEIKNSDQILFIGGQMILSINIAKVLFSGVL